MPDVRIPSIAASPEQLHSPADGEMPVDHERLRNVTRILGARQGLYTVLFGMIWLLKELGDVWEWREGWLSLRLSLPAGIAIVILANRRWIPRYYRKRFGHVEPREISAKQFGVFLGVIILLMFFGEPLAHRVDPMVSSVSNHLHLAISDPAHKVDLAPSFFWAVMLISGLVGDWRSIEWKKLFFVFCGMLAFTSIVLVPIWFPEARQARLWQLFNAGGFGLSLIALGLHDHITLVLMLPKRIADGDDE
jgi:hypothetical protein